MVAEWALQAFAAARVARFVTISPGGRPHIVPCTFALAGDTVYSAVDHKPKTTARLQRLSNIRANPAVAMLADHYAEDWTALWWVRADGQASIIEDAASMAGPLDLLAKKYPQYAERRPDGPVIVIQVGQWTGWSATGQRPPG